MLAVASSSRRYHACSSSSQPAVQIDGLDPSEGLDPMVVMARFAGESGMRPFLSTDGDAASTASGDAASDAINDAVSDAGAETFLFPTPPRSPREGSRAALGFRHRRRWNSFSGAQELPGGCGVCDAPESLDGATNGDIAYYGASTNGVIRISGGEENTRSAEERCDLTRLPRPSAAHYSAPPAAAAAVAAAGATSPLPAESLRRPDQIYGSKSNAMWPRSQSHSAVVGRRDPSDGSDTMGGRRLGRHRRIRTVTARVKKRILSGEAVTVSPCGSGMLSEDSTHWPCLPCLLIVDTTPLPSSLVVSSLVSPTTVHAVILKAHLAAATLKTYPSSVSIQTCHGPLSFGSFLFARFLCTVELQCYFLHSPH
ncbi:unnamed protein product [Closterium sp. Naga37s-1]|nr:unnamed protein product [Closterium sp. Naga37s-1]